MSFIPGSKPTAPPTARGLIAGKAFTAVVFALVLTGMLAAVFAADSPVGRNLAAAGFIGGAAVYLVAALIMYVRGDYILRMFGCAWPLILAKADEMQRAQRQRAFSFTFIVFLSVASLWIGAHVGVLAAQQADAEPLTGLLPSAPWSTAALLVFVFFTLTLLPQAYLAWTLKPLNEEEAE